MEEQIINALTGPFSALVLSVAILYWVANKALPIVQKYLEDQNHKLGEMVKALEKTVESHEADRHVFESAINKLSRRLDRVEEDVSAIKEKLS
jgi:hypothetical protein